MPAIIIVILAQLAYARILAKESMDILNGKVGITNAMENVGAWKKKKLRGFFDKNEK